MRRILNIVLMTVTACWMTSCRVFDVEDDLYDIDKEQAKVALQLRYLERSEDATPDGYAQLSWVYAARALPPADLQ